MLLVSRGDCDLENILCDMNGKRLKDASWVEINLKAQELLYQSHGGGNEVAGVSLCNRACVLEKTKKEIA